MADWRQRAAWCVLDTHWADATHFNRLWDAWQTGQQHARLLHYVAILPASASLDHLLRALPGPVVHALGTSPGQPASAFQRLEFQAGQILLTLCRGPLQAMLREQEFVADTILLYSMPESDDGQPWDNWSLKALARLCRRGTRLQAGAASPALLAALQQAGFVPEAEGDSRSCTASYQPRWEPGNSRQAWRQPPPAPSHCAVVGAGLAGAAAAAALARRGWQVTVLDAAPSAAAAASGLPAGLLVPQLSRDDGVRSRLSRAGVHLTLQWCRRLLVEGRDWAPSGVQQWQADADAAALWHGDGAWVRPARLVAACLAQAGIRFVGEARVQRLLWDDGQWAMRDAQGQVLAQAPQVVLAAAGDTRSLLLASGSIGGAPPLPAVRLRPMPLVAGQVSWGWRHDGDVPHFPATPVNGHGHLLPAVPTDGGLAWFAGATYEPLETAALSEGAAHAHNRRRLAQLLPQTEAALAPDFENGRIQAWRGLRCTTSDRLPAVGALQQTVSPSLWASAGMGSRGLTYAVLAAELLASRIGAEPLPLEGRLARLLAASRPGLSDHL